MTKLVRDGVLVLGLLLGAAGCGGNPLIATWRSPTLLGQPAPADASFSTDFTFNADQTLSVHIVGVGTGGPSTSSAGCTGTIDITNLTWASPDGASGTANTVSITGTGVATDEVTGCTNTTQNHARQPNTMYSNVVDLHGTYAIAGDQLTLTLAMGGSPTTISFTRR